MCIRDRNKYRSMQDIPLEDVYEIISEFGYQHMTEILNSDEDSIRTFLGFLNFIHMNKGTRKGMEFVFRLLNMDYEVSEWWEQSPMGEQHTFNIDLLSFSPNDIRGFEVINKIIDFTRNYVYPILNNLTIQFVLDDLFLNWAIVSQQAVYITLQPDTDIPSTLIWNEGNWNQKNWA